MIKEILSSISGIEIWPVLAMFLFFGMFFLILIWVVKLDKSYIKEMEELPLEPDELPTKGE